MLGYFNILWTIALFQDSRQKNCTTKCSHDLPDAEATGLGQEHTNVLNRPNTKFPQNPTDIYEQLT